MFTLKEGMVGLLFNDHYWARIANLVFQLRPLPGSSINRDDAVQLLEIACKAFSDLTRDSDFETDLQECVKIGEEARQNAPTLPEEFEAFTSAFRDAELEVLTKAGVDLDATIAICEELTDLLKTPYDPADFERLPDKINILQQRICTHAKDPNYRNDMESELIDDVGDALIGVAAVSIDGVAVSQTGPALGLLIGQSVGVGILKLKKILQRWW